MQTKWHWTGDEVTLEDARLIYLNFEGRETKFKDAGNRQFTIILPEKLAEEMLEQKWNVRRMTSRDPGALGEPVIDVAVGFKFRPPRIIMITEKKKKRTDLGEDLCGLLDDVRFAWVDLTIRPREWEFAGKKGIKVYLSTLYAIIRENYLDLKYEDWGNEQTPALPAGPSTPSYDWDAEEVHEIESGR